MIVQSDDLGLFDSLLVTTTVSVIGITKQNVILALLKKEGGTLVT
jgi:hypothetical protein